MPAETDLKMNISERSIFAADINFVVRMQVLEVIFGVSSHDGFSIGGRYYSSCSLL